MTLLDFRKPKCVVVKEKVSWSGKYKIFYGHHYVKGHTCYDIGAVNRTNGEITTRHYIDKGVGNPKAEALMIFDNLQKEMLRAPKSEENEDLDPRLADEFRRQLNKGRSN